MIAPTWVQITKAMLLPGGTLLAVLAMVPRSASASNASPLQRSVHKNGPAIMARLRC